MIPRPSSALSLSLSLALGSAVLAGCTSDSAKPKQDAPTQSSPNEPAGAAAAPDDGQIQPGPSINPLLPRWCEGAGPSVADQENTMYAIGNTFVEQLGSNCLLAGLMRNMGDTQRGDWLNYIILYTYAIAGCELVFGPPEGGILVFGLANTPAVDLPRAPLAADDVDLLIRTYVDLFAPALALSAEARGQLEAYLLRTAASQIDPAVSHTLSLCGRDAGAVP